MKSTYKLSLSGLFIAIGALSGSLLFIPIGVIKAFPIQHLINVLSACLLGPFYAVLNAFAIALLRNLMGTGTILAFPGSLVGALLASLLFYYKPKATWAFLGEVVGTGLIGAFIASLMAKHLLGSTAGATVFFLSFFASSLIGAGIALGIYMSLSKLGVLKHVVHHS